MTSAEVRVPSASALSGGAGARPIRLGAPVVSLVFATAGETSNLRALEEVAAECQRYDVELVVVCAGEKPQLNAALTHAQLISAPAGTAVPQLRSIGANAAQGDIVAFTEDNQPVTREWIAWFASRQRDQSDAEREQQSKPAAAGYENQGARQDA